MSTAHHFARLTGLVREVTIELFAELSIALRPDGAHAPRPGSAVAASIGFSHELARGTLTLFAPNPGAMAFWPVGTRIGSTPEAMRDLFAELANMLLGRIKLRLLRYDVCILLSTPSAWSGADFEIDAIPGGASAWLAFESDNGTLFVRFDAAIDDGFHLSDQPVRELDIEPGELIIF